MTSSDRRKSRARSRAKKTICPSCGGAGLPEARFCHACGTPLEGGAGGRTWSAGMLAALGAGAVLVAVLVFGAATYFERKSAQRSAVPEPAFDAAPATPSQGQPDLSRLTPRQAADRLFNRIMMASERGEIAEALRFVPMAIQAYDALPSLDRDARFHLGLIHDVADDRANVERQIAALREGAPNHLLALALEHGMAERSRDSAAVARVLKAFAAAYDAEMAMQRPEYEAHGNTIERLRAAAASEAAPSAAEPSGAALFATHCAACHGAGAAGSDRGPPLVDRIYEPSHHDDASFLRAMRQGVRAHHWSFGDMPTVAGVSDDEADRIIAHVRALQRAAGIR